MEPLVRGWASHIKPVLSVAGFVLAAVYGPQALSTSALSFLLLQATAAAAALYLFMPRICSRPCKGYAAVHAAERAAWLIWPEHK